MKISNPKAKYGDKVLVLNYRYKPAKWCEGECRDVSYGTSFGGEMFWSYGVYISSKRGYFVYVGDDKINKLGEGHR